MMEWWNMDIWTMLDKDQEMVEDEAVVGSIIDIFDKKGEKSNLYIVK